jgi:hypothetical protein
MSLLDVWEEYGNQVEKTRGGSKKIRRKFGLMKRGGIDELSAYIAIRAYAFKRYSGIIDSINVTEEDESSEIWHGECTFISPDAQKLLQNKGLPEYLFSTKGGTAHVTHSLKTVKHYAGKHPQYRYNEDTKKFEIVKYNNGQPVLIDEDIPNLKNGLNWNEESAAFDGTEIIVPSWKSTVKVTVPNQTVDANYLKSLRKLTGCINLTPFDGMDRGECLFAGCDGVRRAQEPQQNEEEEEESDLPDETNEEPELFWDLTFEFLGAPSRRTWIENIGYVKKRGWEFMHMLSRPICYPYEEKNTVNAFPEEKNDTAYESVELDPETAPEGKNNGLTISTPVACYIEQVYPYADFNVFGLELPNSK